MNKAFFVFDVHQSKVKEVMNIKIIALYRSVYYVVTLFTQEILINLCIYTLLLKLYLKCRNIIKIEISIS